MKRKALMAVLFLTGALAAQTTTYTGTIKDLSGAAVTSGNVIFTLTAPIDTTISGSSRFVPTSIQCGINGTGGVVAADLVSACTVTQNTALTPSGTSYTICIQPYFTTPGACFIDYAVTSSKDISTVAPTPALMPNYNYLNPSIATSSGAVTLGPGAVGNVNTFTASQVFNAGITGTGSIGNLTLGSGALSAATSWSGVNTSKYFNGVRNAALFTGADIGAKVNAAIADCVTNCEVLIPAGSYSFATTINLASGITLKGQGTNATILTYTGSTTAILGTNVSRAWVKNLQLSGTAGVGIKYYGTQGGLDNLYIHGSFSKCAWVTGDGVSAFSTTIWFKALRIDSVTGIGMQVDHTIEFMPDDVSIYGTPNNVTASLFVIDTGTSGVNAHDVNLGYGGLNALRVQNTISPGAGGYNAAPIFLFFDQLVADTTTGGDGIKFDSTLGSSIVSAFFSNSWAAASGLSDVPAVVTAAANGVGIYGGIGINFQGRIRLNANNGVYINSASASQIQVHDSQVIANNFANNADANGVYINTATTNVALDNNVIGNVIESGGHQKYGVKISAVAANVLRLSGNDLSNNVTDSFLDGNLGTSYKVGNFSSTGTMPTSILYGPTIFTAAITSYNGTATAGFGIPVIVGKADATVQAANVAAATLYSVPASGAGMYRASCWLVVTQAATTSSTAPSCQVNWTDVDSSAVQGFQNLVATNTTNSVGSSVGMLASFAIINVKASTTIQYQTSGYVSTGATPMQYAVHLKLEYLGN